MLDPVTVTVASRLAFEFSVPVAGVTVIAGANNTELVTVTVAVPLVAAYSESPA
jgi:hypothetical protein